MVRNDDNRDTDLSLKLQKELPQKGVLIIDRYPAARDSLRLMLSNLDISLVTGAATSAEALRLVRANTYDIILSDYLLDDGRDGQQLLEEMRLKRLIPRGTVYMIVTSERSYHNIVSVAELAPDDYLIKPFTGDQLQARLLKAVFKKGFFAPVYRRLDEGAYVSALATCDRLLVNSSPFELEVMHLKGEILNTLRRYDDAEAVYRNVLARKAMPWARMGLAQSLRGSKRLQEAESLALEVVKEFPEYLAAYDFLADVREEMGRLKDAQEVLERAALLSPNNTSRQRIVGDVAVRNGDLDTAEKAYGKVLERHRSTSLKQMDDYANLSRVLLDKGSPDSARKVIQELKRDWRGNKQGEYTAAVMDSLCLHAEGEPGQAKKATEAALALYDALAADRSTANQVSLKIAVDLAHACLATGHNVRGEEIVRKVAAENNDNSQLIAHIEGMFERSGNSNVGRKLLDEVNCEIVELNNRGVLAARGGNLEEAIRLLTEAAESVPSVQFLVNAANAMCALMDRQGWRDDLGQRAGQYIEEALSKNPHDSRVLSGREIYQRVAAKYGAPI